MSAVLLKSEARTSTTITPEQKALWRDRGIILFLDVTANPGGAETLTLQVQTKDPVGGGWANLTTFGATTAATNALYMYTLYPSAAETAATSGHEVQALPLPPIWRARITHSSTGSWTYTVGAYTVS